jgi:hypothetical protein
VFDDGVIVHLYEEEFVANLASQHQAAPCEYQKLATLKQKIQAAPSPPGMEWWSKKELSRRRVLGTVIESSSSLPVSCTICIDRKASNELSRQLYSQEEGCKSSQTAVSIVLDIVSERGRAEEGRLYSAFLSASRKLKLPVLRQCFVQDACQDFEAATLVADGCTCTTFLLPEPDVFEYRRGERVRCQEKT